MIYENVIKLQLIYKSNINYVTFYKYMETVMVMVMDYLLPTLKTRYNGEVEMFQPSIVVGLYLVLLISGSAKFNQRWCSGCCLYMAMENYHA